MGLSNETVRTHTRNLYRKLGVGDRASAVAIAWREAGALSGGAGHLSRIVTVSITSTRAGGTWG